MDFQTLSVGDDGSVDLEDNGKRRLLVDRARD